MPRIFVVMVGTRKTIAEKWVDFSIKNIMRRVRGNRRRWPMSRMSFVKTMGFLRAIPPSGFSQKEVT
jgi:hypothetical protein